MIRAFPCPLPFSIALEALAKAGREMKEAQGVQIRKDN
jgi:hypothetical protein